MFYSVVLLSPALLFLPSTLSLFSNPQHELVLPVTLIYKNLCRPTSTSIWLPSSLTQDPLTSNSLSTGRILLSRSIINHTFNALIHTSCQDKLSLQTLFTLRFNWLIQVSPVSFEGLLSKHCHGWVTINRGLRQSTIVKIIWNCLIYHFSFQHLKILNFLDFCPIFMAFLPKCRTLYVL